MIRNETGGNKNKMNAPLDSHTLSDEDINWLAQQLKIETQDKIIEDISMSLSRIQKVDLSRAKHRLSISVERIALFANATALLDLNLSGSAIRDITLLRKLIHLQRLDLSHTKVVDLKPLSALPNLEHLHFWNTSINDITPLASLQHLKSLELCRTKVSDLSPLSGLKKITTLDIYYTNITDIQPLTQIKSLESLFLDGNDAQNLDLLTRENFPRLKELMILDDDYYPILEPDRVKLGKVKAQLPDCRISRRGLY